jgi:hypothetical protein
MMVRALERVEGCKKIAMPALRSSSTAMGLLRQPKRLKSIFTERHAAQILLIMKWAEELDASTLARGATSCGRSIIVRIEKRIVRIEKRHRGATAAKAGGRGIDQAPADGRLAAAISTISANR